MSDIPEDIMHAVDTLIAVTDDLDLSTEQFAARAIMAERERCALAAERRGKELREYAIGSDIANTIRDGLAPTPSASPV